MGAALEDTRNGMAFQRSVLVGSMKHRWCKDIFLELLCPFFYECECACVSKHSLTYDRRPGRCLSPCAGSIVAILKRSGAWLVQARVVLVVAARPRGMRHVCGFMHTWGLSACSSAGVRRSTGGITPWRLVGTTNSSTPCGRPHVASALGRRPHRRGVC